MKRNPAPTTSPIFLTGMMGAGKSTIGPRLAERLGRVFLDTDREIERETGCSIPEIFANDGEARFRALEAQAIERAAESGGVVALGGGAIAQPGAADRLDALGVVVFLRVDPTVLIERLGQGDDRPLLAGLGRAERVDRLRALLAERSADYARATIEVDAARSTERVVDEIVAALHDRTVSSSRSQPDEDPDKAPGTQRDRSPDESPGMAARQASEQASAEAAGWTRVGPGAGAAAETKGSEKE